MIQPPSIPSVSAALSLLILGASGPSDLRGQAPAAGTIASMPIVSVGDASGDPDRELARAESAVRLPSGEIVVAAPRESRLVWFDAGGRFVRTLGRRGAGPNEFGQSVFVYGRGDTVVAHDAANSRFHFIDSGGTFARTDTAGDRNRAAWQYNRTVFFRLPDGVDLGRLAATIARIPAAAGDTIRLAHALPGGGVWIRDAADTLLHAVYDSEGRRLGTVRNAQRFEIYQVLDSLVLGRWRDADDIEFIQVRRYALLAQPGPAAPVSSSVAYDQAGELARNAPLVAQLRAASRNVITAMEVHYSVRAHYATSLADIQLNLPPGVRGTLFRAARDEYAVILEHPSTRVTCVTFMLKTFVHAGSPLCG